MINNTCSVFFLSDVDPCFPNPCDHSGLCIYTNDNSGFRCNCTLGFKGSRCSGKYELF